MSTQDDWAAWIRFQLEQLRMDQRDLAEGLGWDPSAVSRTLNGVRKLKRREMDSIVVLLSQRWGNVRLPPPPGWSHSSPWAAEEELQIMSVRQQMRRKGLVLDDIVRGTDIAERDIQSLLKSTDRTRRPDVLSRVVAFLEVDVKSGHAHHPSTHSLRHAKRPTAGARRRATTGGPSLPIFLPPQQAADGSFHFDRVVAERRAPPPQLSGVEGAFGFYAPTQSLEPRYFGGEVIYARPGRPLVAGNFAILERQDGSTLIGQVRHVSQDRIAIGNGPHHFEIPRWEVVSVAQLVGSWCD